MRDPKYTCGSGRAERTSRRGITGINTSRNYRASGMQVYECMCVRAYARCVCVCVYSGGWPGQGNRGGFEQAHARLYTSDVLESRLLDSLPSPPCLACTRASGRCRESMHRVRAVFERSGGRFGPCFCSEPL